MRYHNIVAFPTVFALVVAACAGGTDTMEEAPLSCEEAGAAVVEFIADASDDRAGAMEEMGTSRAWRYGTAIEQLTEGCDSAELDAACEVLTGDGLEGVLAVDLYFELCPNAALAAPSTAAPLPDPAEEPGTTFAEDLEDPSGLLEGLLGGDGTADMESLLEELLGGDGTGDLGPLLEGLLGGDGSGDVEALFEGLLGGDGEAAMGGLDPEIMQCIAAGNGAGFGGMLAAPQEHGTLSEELPDIVSWLEDERGLEFSVVPEPVLLDSADMSARVMDLFTEDFEESGGAIDELLLEALGAIPPGTDLKNAYLTLLDEQVAGFYDDETGELVVRSDDPNASLDGVELIILAHELNHALTDERLGLPLDDEALAADSDAERAALALVEGDATLVMQRYSAQKVNPLELLGLDATSTAALEASPDYLTDSLMFSYSAGMAFVCNVYAQDGWAGIDAAYDDPPTTTAQILWPERYRTREGPVATPALGNPGADWTEARTDTFGAADLMWLFEAPGDDPAAALSDPLDRAFQWAGGTVTVWTRDDDTALGLAFVDRDGSDELCSSITTWYQAAFPDSSVSSNGGTTTFAQPGRAGVITCDGGDVVVGIAPEVDVAEGVIED